jgi:hypothetical protein
LSSAYLRSRRIPHSESRRLWNAKTWRVTERPAWNDTGLHTLERVLFGLGEFLVAGEYGGEGEEGAEHLSGRSRMLYYRHPWPSLLGLDVVIPISLLKEPSEPLRLIFNCIHIPHL